jgi:hypothetical protein
MITNEKRCLVQEACEHLTTGHVLADDQIRRELISLE